MNWNDLVSSAEEYVVARFQQMHLPELLYHNRAHTEYVVARVQEIGEYYRLREHEFACLLIAAWFHDTGHLSGAPENHEQRSVEDFRKFASINPVPAADAEIIENCICATRLPHRPETFLQEILCDADTYNLGTPDFAKTDLLLKDELKARDRVPDISWDDSTLFILQKHQYFTNYCKTRLAQGKAENIEAVKIRKNNGINN
ncbi:MAG: hypothetical protein EOO15_00850 [Chitinophagaceae bacterium]|nr:MAG: hypothetical protein EOO15_00850 [Chitinophagaceae bacterium]